MKKSTQLLIGIIVIILIVILYKTTTVSAPVKQVSTLENSYKNTSYGIENGFITLKEGISDLQITPDYPARSITKYFGNELRTDLNGDGVNDIAFLMTQNNGGSGVFYYLTTAINAGEVYTGTNSIYIGDRIAPQTTEFVDGRIVVNYAERKKDEPMSASPSIGVSRYFKIDGGYLVEVVKR